MKAVIVGVLLALGIAITPSTASAADAPTYKSCKQLRKAMPNGVAKSNNAARRQTRTGYYKPKVKRAVYVANKRLDRDRDLTVCEKKQPATTPPPSPEPQQPTPPPPPPPPPDPWITLNAANMSPLEVMDFTTGTSLNVTGMYLDPYDGVYETVTTTLNGAPITGSSGTGGLGYQYYPSRLTDGQVYEFIQTVITPAHWYCSVTLPSGCAWLEKKTEVKTWQFTYSTANPGRIMQATKVSWRMLY